MKDKELYMGIKCGFENGLLCIVNPYKLTLDTDDNDFWESPVGENLDYRAGESVRMIWIPICDIKNIATYK